MTTLLAFAPWAFAILAALFFGILFLILYAIFVLGKGE
jgi:hypothetical protein